MNVTFNPFKYIGFVLMSAPLATVLPWYWSVCFMAGLGLILAVTRAEARKAAGR